MCITDGVEISFGNSFVVAVFFFFGYRFMWTQGMGIRTRFFFFLE